MSLMNLFNINPGSLITVAITPDALLDNNRIEITPGSGGVDAIINGIGVVVVWVAACTSQGMHNRITWVKVVFHLTYANIVISFLEL